VCYDYFAGFIIISKEPRECPHKLYIAKIWSHWATSSSVKVYRSVFIQIFVVSSERRTRFESGCIMTLQGHPRLMILPSEKARVGLRTS